MKKQLIVALFILLTTLGTNAQDKYFTKTGKIYFNCTGGVEKIEATNKTVTCVLDSKNGMMQFSLLMKGFEFERALMMEHFNENYVESEKFPKAGFAGTISNSSEVNYSKDGTYPVKVKGKLTMHGVSQDVEAPGKIVIKAGKVAATSDFTVKLSEFGIKIPGAVQDKISNEVKIAVELSLEPLKG